MVLVLCPSGTEGTAPDCRPLPDTDGDTIADRVDACPERRGEPSLDPRQHGCAPLDTDGDGLADRVDRCPLQRTEPAFDRNGDGCDDEGDRDGIPDANDACPRESGPDSADAKTRGCPRYVRVGPRNVFLLSPIEFEIDKGAIKSSSLPILDDVARVLMEHPELSSIEVQGHFQQDPHRARSLSQLRADSVRKALIERGVAAARLTSRGYGEERPIDTNKTEAGRKRNRRIEIWVQTDR
jgi:OOP family OmpA-OmpF porin